MASRGSHPVDGAKTKMHLLTGKLTGAGAANMVNAESAEPGGGEIVSAVRTGTGAFTLTFRHSYPRLQTVFRPQVLGTTAGLSVRFLTFNPDTKTATIQCEVGAVATDPAATDTLHFQWVVRNTAAA